jgi:hypothetical protein
VNRHAALSQVGNRSVLRWLDGRIVTSASTAARQLAPLTSRNHLLKKLSGFARELADYLIFGNVSPCIA